MLTYYLQTIQFFFLIYNSLNNLSQWASESVSTHPSVWTRSWPAPARRRPGRPGHSSCSAGWEEAGCCSPRCHWTDHLSTVAATWNIHRDIQREFIMWSQVWIWIVFVVVPIHSAIQWMCLSFTTGEGNRGHAGKIDFSHQRDQVTGVKLLVLQSCSLPWKYKLKLPCC